MRIAHAALSERCAVRAACRAYIEQDDLGGGNWTGGELTEHGRPVGRVSYNGRVWEMAEGEQTAPRELLKNGGL